MQHFEQTDREEHFYQELIRPLLFKLDPEDAHNLAHRLLHWFSPFLPALPCRYESKLLQTDIASTVVPNPVGLAAGFDKNAELVSILASLGFGYAEVGSITARAGAGNPRPRLFRLPEDNALINRMGLNGHGADVIARRLAQSRRSLPVGINIAKTHDPAITGDAAIADILYSFNAVRDLPSIYVAFNASCPNTQEGRLEEKKLLNDVFVELQKANSRRVPLLVKVSPDSSDQLLEDIVEVSVTNGVSGFICGNTTTTRNQLRTGAAEIAAIGNGGLSGEPLRPLAQSLVRRVARLKKREQIIIGVGGISSAADAYRLIRQGASAVQIYTAFIYKGPFLVRKICQELESLLERDGLSLKEATGADLA